MRLSEVLNKVPGASTHQIENFLGARTLKPGAYRNVKAGKVIWNRHCRECTDMRTFVSGDTLSCLVAGETTVSIDALLNCAACQKESLVVWFLVKANDDLFSQAPEVFVERFTEYRKASTGFAALGPDLLDGLLMHAQAAYGSGLGAGSIIYLRKAFETVTSEAARALGIDAKATRGKRKTFQALLKEVHDATSIIPEEFSNDGYTLFRELSNVIHGDTDEATALEKFKPCYALVIGIVEKARNREIFADAITQLGWAPGANYSSEAAVP